MQSYREESTSGARPVSQLDPLPAPSRGDDMGKYHQRYEEAMNPFEAFRGRVSAVTFLFSWSKPSLCLHRKQLVLIVT